MKRLKLLMLFICVSITFSCTDSTDEELGLTGEGSLTAKVSGNDFTSLSVAVSATVTNGILVVQGSNSLGEYIRINISNYNGVGVYNTGDAISNTNSISYGTIDPIVTWISTFDIGTGTIEITEESATTIKGTFNFIGHNDSNGVKEITNGIFEAPKN